MSKEKFLYAARDPKTGELVANMTNPRKKFWERKQALVKTICEAIEHKDLYDSLELVTFKLIEENDDAERNER